MCTAAEPVYASTGRYTQASGRTRNETVSASKSTFLECSPPPGFDVSMQILMPYLEIATRIMLRHRGRIR